MTREDYTQVTEPLLAWFDSHKRDLPWRRTSDAYRIWVSEIMLQQTQVDRVIDYYRRFLDAFPTVEDLADATIDEVLGLWEGLGYYSRARNMLAAARHIVADYGGRFPRTFGEALALPGVGEYTAGAVLSIAFGVPLPALDANAIRVLARTFGVKGDVSKGKARRRIMDIAGGIVPEDRPGDFNQALMELGALICIAGTPGCLICPLTEVCAARQKGVQAQIPPPKSRPVKEIAAVAGVVRAGDRVLIARRPAEGQWGGLWEFPNTRAGSARAPADTLGTYIESAFGLTVEVGEELVSFVYGVMNRRVTLMVLNCFAEVSELAPVDHDEARWVRARQLADMAMPSPHRAIAETLTDV